jgi:hypothetical protein
MGPAIDLKGNTMARSHYQFQKRQTELDNKKNKQEKRLRKLESKALKAGEGLETDEGVETDEGLEADGTEDEPTLPADDLEA